MDEKFGMYSSFSWCRETHCADLFSLQKVLLYSNQWKILDAWKLIDEDSSLFLFLMHFIHIKQIFIGYHLSIHMLNILLEYLWWWEVEKATNCLYLVTGLVLAELHHRKQKSALMLEKEKWTGSTEYTYVHLAAHMDTPKFSWFNLLMYATSIIWQNICTEQLACLSSRLRENFEIHCIPGSQKDTVCLSGRLSASQHAAVPFLLECSKKSWLLSMFLLVWAPTAILKATASVLFCIKIICLSTA